MDRLPPLSGCGGRTDAATDVPRDSASGLNRRDSEPTAVVVDSAMLGAIKIDVIREHAVPRTLVVAGKVQFDEDRLARVLAPLPGQVVDLRAKVGDGVRKGQALCAFVTVVSGMKADDKLKEELKAWVAKEIGSIAKPRLRTRGPKYSLIRIVTRWPRVMRPSANSLTTRRLPPGASSYRASVSMRIDKGPDTEQP